MSFWSIFERKKLMFLFIFIYFLNQSLRSIPRVTVFFKRFPANSDWPMTFFTSFYESSFITIPFLDFAFHYISYLNVSFIPFYFFFFWSLLAMKLRKKMGKAENPRKENHATKLTQKNHISFIQDKHQYSKCYISSKKPSISMRF